MNLPDENCYTLPDGNCIGENCMHDPSPKLHDHEIMVHMVRRGTNGHDARVFATILPAVDAESATRAGVEFGHAIGAASKWEWKFAGLDGGDVTVTRLDDVPSTS